MSEKWGIGRVVDGRYEVRRIRRGGMGVAFICYDAERDGPVVLKTFKDEYLFNEKIVRRFSDEAYIWVRLDSHPNIVRAYSVVNIGFRPYLVLEYVTDDEAFGLTLGGYIRAGGMALDEAVDFSLQFCAGMIHAGEKLADAERDFVHADIKPSNIFIKKGAILKITDFGLARSREDRERLSEWGSPSYMSPEQREGASLDVRSDVFSFGCVLYEMIAGRKAFASGRSDAPGRLIDIRPDCPEALDEIVMSCLMDDMAKRPSDFIALREALSSLPRTDAASEPRGRPSYEIPLDHREMAEKGVSLINIGKYREAVACFDSVLEESGEDSARYCSFCGRGSAFAGLGRSDQAAIEFDNAIRILPAYPDAYVMRADVDNNRGRLDEALERYDAAIVLDGRYGIGYYNRGICLERLGRFEKALDDFGRAIELGICEAYTNRAGVRRRLGKTEEALSDYESAIRMNPRNAIALGGAGAIYGQMGLDDQAMDSLALAIEMNPEYIPSYFFRAELSAKSGRFVEAIADFEKALAIDPSRAGIHSSLKYDMTQAEIDRIHATIFHDCGIVYLRVGRIEDARASLSRFIEKATPEFEKEISLTRFLLENMEREFGN
jgi:tetratricopeptide (TPR) repeat protein